MPGPPHQLTTFDEACSSDLWLPGIAPPFELFSALFAPGMSGPQACSGARKAGSALPVADGLGEVRLPDVPVSSQVGDGPRHLEYTVAGPG